MAITFKYIIAFCLGTIFAFFVAIRMLLVTLFHGKRVLSGPKFRKRPEIISDGRYGKSGYLHLKNITLHFVEAGDKSKPLLLLVHGFPEFWFSWRHQLANEDLVNNFHVVAIDMRGYGDSDKPTSLDDYTTKALAEDVKETVQALGHTSCHLAGHDWGGAVAWAVATRHPEVVRRLIILSTPHPTAFARGLHSNRRQFLASWYMFLFQVPAFPEWLITRGDCHAFNDVDSLTPEEREAFKFTFGSRAALRCPINYYRAAFRAMAAGELNIPKSNIRQPTLMIFGAKEKYLMEATARLSADYCDDFRFELLPNATHWLQQDDPAAVNRLIFGFISQEPHGELEEAGKRLAAAGAKEQQQQQQQQQQQEDGVRVSFSIGGDSASLDASLSG